MNYPKYRVTEWLDTNDLSVLYGVQIRPSRESSWLNVANGQNALFFREHDKAEQTIKDFKKGNKHELEQKPKQV